MKDSQQSMKAVWMGFKYIKVNNERFSTPIGTLLVRI